METFSILQDSTALIPTHATIPPGCISAPRNSVSLSPPGSAFPDAQRPPGRSHGPRRGGSERVPAAAALHGAPNPSGSEPRRAHTQPPAAAPSPCPAPRAALEPRCAKPRNKRGSPERDLAPHPRPAQRPPPSQHPPPPPPSRLLVAPTRLWNLPPPPPPTAGPRPPRPGEGGERGGWGSQHNTAQPPPPAALRSWPPRNSREQKGAGERKEGTRFIVCRSVWRGIRSTPAARAETPGWTLIEREGHEELQPRARGLLAACGSSGQGAAAACNRATAERFIGVNAASPLLLGRGGSRTKNKHNLQGLPRPCACRHVGGGAEQPRGYSSMSESLRVGARADWFVS